MSPRILVLTSATGAGHDMRARAFRDWVRQLHGDAVEVRIEQVIENASALGAFGVWLYNFIQRHQPRLHAIYWHIVEWFIRWRISYGGRYYRRLLAAYRPGLILSVHDSTNRGYFEDAHRVLGADRVRCVTYCGEWSGGPGFSRNWISPAADCFYARTDESLAFATTLGMPAARCRRFTAFLPPAACTPAPTAADRRRARAEQFGLDPDRFTLFLATGGHGAHHHPALLRALLPLADRVQVIAVCGRNTRALRQLERWRAAHPALRLYLEGYCQRMLELLRAADAVVTRGGANTTMEALHAGCVPVFNGLGGLMPQERLTVSYFTRHGAGALVRSPTQLANLVARWLNDPAAWHSCRDCLLALQPDDDPRAFVNELLGLLPG
jgi:processive 1,2-diacylglycerol beta-glucosyltransferase